MYKHNCLLNIIILTKPYRKRQNKQKTEKVHYDVQNNNSGIEELQVQVIPLFNRDVHLCIVPNAEIHIYAYSPHKEQKDIECALLMMQAHADYTCVCSPHKGVL